MRQEQTDQAQIVKDWASYLAADKTHCVQPKVYMPSYVEWLTCLEIARDVRRMGGRKYHRLDRRAVPTLRFEPFNPLFKTF
jgi:hypothetical protein